MFNLGDQYLIQQRNRQRRAQLAAEQQTTTKTELTPAGEQHVIPGCERNASPKASQLDLFG